MEKKALLNAFLLKSLSIVDLTAQGFPCTLQNGIMRILLRILTLEQEIYFSAGSLNVTVEKIILDCTKVPVERKDCYSLKLFRSCRNLWLLYSKTTRRSILGKKINKNQQQRSKLYQSTKLWRVTWSTEIHVDWL